MTCHCSFSCARRLVTNGIVVVSTLLVMHGSALGEPVKHVLIIHGESPGLPGGEIVADALRSTLQRQSPSPVEFYQETLDKIRFSSDAYDQRFAYLLAEKYREVPLDLVVAFTSPAVDFVLRHGLFPRTPVVLGYIERRFLENRAVPEKTSVVFVQIDAVSTIRLALNLYPKARKVVVVGGTSEFDRHWQAVVREDLRDFGPKIPVTYEVDSRLEDLRWMVATLPADTIVLYISMTRDAANIATAPRAVLQSLRSASHVPIFGLSSTYVGYGMVGGALLDTERHGIQLGEQGARLLRGEAPSVETTHTIMAVDWREMQRFGMSAVALPPSTAIAYREPGVWERYRTAILAIGFVVLAEGALIAALIWLVRRRRESQRLLEKRLKFQKLASAVSLSLTEATPREINFAVEKSLSHVAAAAGIDSAWRWERGEKADEGWHSALRDGSPVVFDDVAELPPTIREKLRSVGITTATSLAVPLSSGALFWISTQDRSSWRAHRDELQIVSAIVANVLERRRAEDSFQTSDALKGAILDSLPSQVAVLDREGTIIAVNDAWLAFGEENGAAPTGIGAGVSYVAACKAGARNGEPTAAEALALIEAACNGQRSGIQLEYRCSSTEVDRWFRMRAEPLRRPGGGAVVTHTDITEAKMTEIALRESEERFRRLADALPVAVWTTNAEGTCNYVNEQWLQMTGRRLQDEADEGWLGGVHPDDRLRCKETWDEAFGTRQRFTLDYRIRRQDGEYRWVLDIAMPRYGSDGAFYGYVGGAVDVTERREAEQVLREFNRQLILAQEEERRYIARELHDHLNQQLALLAIDLQQLALHPPDSTEALAEALQQEWRRTGEIASDVHAISHRLHPSKLEALGLVTTLRAHCRDLSRQNLEVHFSEQHVSSGVPTDISLALFRVAEQALTNVIHHSGAAQANVTLAEADGQIVLRISDDGCGFKISGRRPHGIGLISMRERVHSVGGTLKISSAPGKGTTVEARVPRLVRRSASASGGEREPQSRYSKHPGVAEPA